MHALCLRELNPNLTEMTLNSFLDVIMSQNVVEWSKWNTVSEKQMKKHRRLQLQIELLIMRLSS